MTKRFYFFILTIIVFISFSCFAASKSHFSYQVIGVKDPLLTNIKKRFALEEQSHVLPYNREDVEALYHQGKEVIREAIQPFGYFKPRISSRLTHKGSEWQAEYKIDPGPEIRIANITINITGPGEENKKIQKFVHDFPIKKGNVFITENYEKAKEKLFSIAHEQGFIKAQMQNNRVLIDTHHYHVSLNIQMDTGPKYYFGNFSFSNNHYAPAFLSRFDPNIKGKPFSSAKLVEYQQDLANSYYFATTNVTPDFDHIENYQIPVHVSVIPPKARRYSLGLGYGTSTGPRFTAGLSLRRLTNTGQHFDAQLKLSSVLSGVAAKYYIPGYNPLTDQWVISSNIQKFTPQNGTSTSGTISGGYETKRHHWTTSLNLNYLIERYKVNDHPTRFSRLFYPSLNIGYVKADDPIHPRFGRSFNFTLEGGSQSVFSSTNFLQAEIKGKYLFSPMDIGRIILRGDLGYTAVENIDDLPMSMRFWAGGLNSVRAFRDSSIGPGRYLVVGSIEYQHKIAGTWDGAIFYDIGKATNQFSSPFNQSRGVGIIYQSMIGPIKLYVANKKVVHKDNRIKNAYGIEFSIGPEF